MADYFEIDFLDVECDKSGDAIASRYEVNGVSRIHITDGGFQDTGESLVKHIRTYYGNPTVIDAVVVTHPDGDHAGGLRAVLESFMVRELWMLRPWLFAGELLPQFARFTSVEGLAARLREIYPNIAALEEIATARGIPIREPFQGARIGGFTVLAPTRARYLNLIVSSEKTPESVASAAAEGRGLFGEALRKAAAKAMSLMRAAWGAEQFAEEETSAENDMSVIQFACLSGSTILLTGDAGRGALQEAADFAPVVGLGLPGIDRFQIPHHGSRRNVSSEILDRWLGERLPAPPAAGQERFTAVVSSAKKDTDHPRKAVVRALMHRGAKVVATESRTIRMSGGAAPPRDGWTAVAPEPYPEEQESV